MRTDVIVLCAEGRPGAFRELCRSGAMAVGVVVMRSFRSSGDEAYCCAPALAAPQLLVFTLVRLLGHLPNEILASGTIAAWRVRSSLRS